MNMTDSMLSQLLAAGMPTQAQPSRPADQTGAKREDFDTLVQRKQQEAKSAAGQQPERKEPAETADTPADGNVVPEEQRVLAAALAAQAVVIVPFQDAVAPTEDAIPEAPVAAVPEVQAVKPMEDAPQQPKAGLQEQGQPDAAIVRNSVEAPETAQAPVAKILEQKPETVGGVQQAQSEQGAQVHGTRPEKGTTAYRDIRLERVQEQDGMKMEVTSQIEPQPLFREAEAPVKVGAPEVPVRTEDGDLDSQMAGRVREAIEQGAERIEVKLTPRSMGEVTVELTRTSDGALHVTLHATTERGASLLGEHANSLSALLQSGTQAQVSVEVQRPQELQQPQQSQQQPNDQGWDNDGRQGNPQQESRQQRHQESQDFLQQLRLGLVAPDGAAS